MEIEPLDKKTIKIILSKQDMNDFSITYESMDYDDPATKKVILKLLNQVKEKNKVDLLSGKLFIEAFPKDDGGCILYLNILGDMKENSVLNNNFKSPIIAVISNPFDLFKLCKVLYRKYNHIIFKSHLYEDDGLYYLLIYSFYKQEDVLCGIISEFGSIKGKGEFYSCIVKEHSNLLIKDEAIEKLFSIT